jgi:hypothetical protein
MTIYNRNQIGQFKSKKRIIILNTIYILVLLVVVFIGANWKQTEYITVEKEVIVSNDTAEQIIADKKVEVLDLLEKCESENNASSINWEDYGVGKNRPSFGAYMLKVGTIQLYQSGLSDFEAIALAGDRTRARELSAHIIFDTKGGIYNWKNCMVKEDLLTKVNFIKQLEVEINK